MGEKGHRSSALCDRAEALVLLGELDEADRCLAEAATLASPADIYYEFQSRRSQAQVLTARGQYEEAEALARDALTIVLSTQSTFHQAASYACLAEVLARVGKPAEAATAREEALALCARKEAPAYAAYINRRLDALIGAVSGPDRAPVARQ